MAARSAANVRTAKSAEDLTGAQWSALLLMYLNGSVAKKLLESLSTEEIENIARAMAEVEYVEAQVVEQVIAEFVRELTNLSMVSHTGRAFALDILPELVDEPRRERVKRTLRRDVSTEFRDLVSARPAAALSALLSDEHPQAQAVALLLMGPENASRVLTQFTESERLDLSMRMARLDSLPSDLADDVETSLRARLESGDAGSRWKVEGVDRAAQTLGRLGRDQQEPLLDRIASEDNDLCNVLRRRMVVFDDLKTVPDRGIQALLKGIERQTLLLALRGASSPMRELFLKNMSQRAAADIVDEIEIMGPTAKPAIQNAQEEIVQIALKLQDEGLIQIATGNAEMV